MTLRLRPDIRRAKRLSFDTNALIYFLQDVNPYAQWLRNLFHGLRERQQQVVVSVIAEAELMVKPIRAGDSGKLAAIDELLRSPEVHHAVVTQEVARHAAGIRARLNLRLEDSLIVASAISAGCDVLVGNDRDCARRVTEIPYVYLEDVVSQ